MHLLWQLWDSFLLAQRSLLVRYSLSPLKSFVEMLRANDYGAEPVAGPNDEERGQPPVPIPTTLPRSSSSVSFALGATECLDNCDTMKTKAPRINPTVFFLCAFALVGCGTTTTVRLTGSPGTQVTGHYRASHVSSDFAGGVGWQMSFGRQDLQEFEFRKAGAEQAVDLEIRQGRKVMVKATSEPGTIGLRVRHSDGWKVETVR